MHNKKKPSETTFWYFAVDMTPLIWYSLDKGGEVMKNTIYLKMSISPELHDVFKMYAKSQQMSLADMVRYAVIRDALSAKFITQDEANKLWQRRKRRLPRREKYAN